MYRAAEQKVVIMGARGETEDNKNNKVCNIMWLRVATKMSPPGDLKVAFPVKRDMRLNPYLHDGNDYDTLNSNILPTSTGNCIY